ncbi:hypothetical protein ALC62_12142, partial [Cyphomyrmex costatus]
RRPEILRKINERYGQRNNVAAIRNRDKEPRPRECCRASCRNCRQRTTEVPSRRSGRRRACDRFGSGLIGPAPQPIARRRSPRSPPMRVVM